MYVQYMKIKYRYMITFLIVWFVPGDHALCRQAAVLLWIAKTPPETWAEALEACSLVNIFLLFFFTWERRLLSLLNC